MPAATNFTASGLDFAIEADVNTLFDDDSYIKFKNALDQHTHRSTYGLGVGRVGSVAPAATGDVQVTGHQFRYWDGTAAAIRTIDLSGDVTTAAAVTFSGAFAFTATLTATTGVTFPTTGTLATLAGAEELTNKTLNASVGKGTWTASGTWTLPALTLGGTVSGGGNQLNNVIIGTVTPLAGSFTTLTASTGLTLTGATVTGAPTWSSAQSFPTGTALAGTVALASLGVLSWNSGNYTVTHSAGLLTTSGPLTITGAVTATAITLSDQNAITFTHASAQIIPGATSLTFRNNANSASNLIITDAGVVTVRAGINSTSGQSTLGTTNVPQTTNTGTAILESTSAMAADLGGSIAFGGFYNATTKTNWASISGRKENGTNEAYGGYLAFATRIDGASNVERMRIASTGAVTISNASGVGLTIASALTVTTGGITVTNTGAARALNVNSSNTGLTGITLLANSKTWYIDNRGATDAPNNRLSFECDVQAFYLTTAGAAVFPVGPVTISAGGLTVTAGGATITGAVTVSSTINSQTISATANFTGTLTVASTVIQTAGIHYIGATSNAKMTTGLTLSQGAADDEILALKSSDVNHGITDWAETDTYGAFLKDSGAFGGLKLRGFSEATTAVAIDAYESDANAVKSTAGLAAFTVRVYHRTAAGAGVDAAPPANTNLATFGEGTTTRFILDSDGDSHQDVGTAWTNFDKHDDLALLDATSALLGRDPGQLRRTFTDGFLAENRAKLSDLRVVTFNDDGHHFVNWSRFHMLHMGATRYIGDHVSSVAQRLDGLTAAIRSASTLDDLKRHLALNPA